MKFLEMLKNLFKGNKQYEGISQTLACLNDIVPMPKRTDFHNNQSKLEEIDSCKADYLKLLKQNKTITSIDLMPEYLHEFKNIYTDLLLNLCTEDNTSVSFDLIDETGDPNIEHLNIMVTCIKLMLYQQEVAILEEKTRIRLVALNEILENLLNGRLFTKIKSKELINSLLYEISNLHSALIVFINQKMAMKIESENYLKNISSLYNFETIDIKDEDLISKRLEELRCTLNLINSEELTRLDGMNLNPKLFIATIEQKLEIYVYTHPDLLETLARKVNEISYEVNRKVNYDFTDENHPLFWPNANNVKKKKQEYLEKIREIELLYKIFSKYGRNLVSKEDLYRLYEVKFKILTCDILDVDKIDILSNATFTELECYQEIVFKKIEDILKGRNHNVNFFIQEGTICSDKSLTDIIGYITKTLKDGDNEFSMYKILSNKKLLSFLLAFDEENGLTAFFENNYVSLKDYTSHINTYSELLEWENTIPLSSLYWIISCNMKSERNNPNLMEYINKHEPLYYLFCLNNENFDLSTNYTLPKGIAKADLLSYIEKNVDKTSKTKHTDEIEEVLRSIRKRANKKTIIMPKSLRELSGNIFNKTSIKSVILNEGLRRLGTDALLVPSIEDAVFSSTLEEIFPDAVNLAQLKTITIRIRKRNIAFERLIDNEQLSQCFKLEETKEIEDIDGNKRDAKEFEMGDLVFQVCKLVPTFDELIFINENGEKIIYTKEMIELVTRRKSKIGQPIWWEDSKYLHLTQEEVKLIADKFREIYCDITEQKYVTGSELLTLKKQIVK